jgi:hypothetical protein
MQLDAHHIALIDLAGIALNAFGTRFGLIAALGLGVALTFDWKMGVVFAVFATVGLTISYLVGFSPSHSARSLVAGLFGGVLFGDLHRGLKIGACLALVVAVTSAATVIMSPYVEVWATELPPKRLGFYGILMMIAGS